MCEIQCVVSRVLIAKNTELMIYMNCFANN